MTSNKPAQKRGRRVALYIGLGVGALVGIAVVYLVLVTLGR